jgi:hypothetical protein
MLICLYTEWIDAVCQYLLDEQQMFFMHYLQKHFELASYLKPNSINRSPFARLHGITSVCLYTPLLIGWIIRETVLEGRGIFTEIILYWASAMGITVIVHCWSSWSNRPWRPIGLWDGEAPTFCRQSAHRWPWGCQPYVLVVLISVRRWVDPRVIWRIRSIKKSSDLIENRIFDFPACSIMLQPTTLSRAPKTI